MYSIPKWLAEEKFLTEGTEERGRVYFYGEEVRSTEKATLIRLTTDEEMWFPKSQLREEED